jgi:hypothetical protein
MELTMAHPQPDTVTVNPWPFGANRLELEVPARRVPSTPFEGVDAFREAYARAEPFMHKLTFRPG